MFFIPPLPPFESTIDFITISFATTLILLSLVSISFIFYLKIKSNSLPHLQNFNSLWILRFILVTFISLWSFTQFLALPFFRRRQLYDFLPLTLTQQESLCKIHVVLSLGFLEPGFLLSLIFLITVSIKKKNPKISKIVLIIFSICLPIFFFQIFFVFFSHLILPLPEIFHRSSVLTNNDESVFCTYPLSSIILFGSFAISYLILFLISCFKVVSIVINKGLRFRMYALGFTVAISLVLQIVFLGLSTVWIPDKAIHGAGFLIVFLSALSCATAGEGVLVIRPIVDALAVGGESCSWLPPWPEPVLKGGA